MKLQNNFNKLHQQLTQYGLDPKEWALKPICKMWIDIAHKQDHDFQFRGRYNKRGEILELKLKSL